MKGLLHIGAACLLLNACIGQSEEDKKEKDKTGDEISELFEKRRNWIRQFDLDGDSINDEISFEYSGGAHCCYKLHLTLSSDGIERSYPFEMDGGYVYGVPDNSIPEHFGIKDYDEDGLPEIFMEIQTYNGYPESIPATWEKEFGVTTHYIIIEYADSLEISSIPKSISVDQYFNAVKFKHDPGELHPFSVDDLYGYKDDDENVIILPVLQETNKFSSKVAIVKLNSEYCLIDKKGKIISDFGGLYLMDKTIADNGLILLFDGASSFFYMNDQGKIVNDKPYPDAKSFTEGLAAVEKDGKWGYIDQYNNWVIEPVYDDAPPFKDSRAMVLVNNEMFWIDAKGVRLKK